MCVRWSSKHYIVYQRPTLCTTTSKKTEKILLARSNSRRREEIWQTFQEWLWVANSFLSLLDFDRKNVHSFIFGIVTIGIGWVKKIELVSSLKSNLKNCRLVLNFDIHLKSSINVMHLRFNLRFNIYALGDQQLTLYLYFLIHLLPIQLLILYSERHKGCFHNAFLDCQCV